MMRVYRAAIHNKDQGAEGVYTIYNLEMERPPDREALAGLFCNPLVEGVTEGMPEGEFVEVMYHNGVIDPQQESIIVACGSLGMEVTAAKVSRRYYGQTRNGVFVNKLVQVAFTEEPILGTLRPRGARKGMELFDLTALSGQELMQLSESRDLHLSLPQMRELAQIQRDERLPQVTDVFLETFAARWSDHCYHTTWRALGLFKLLKDATTRIANQSLVSAFKDNAGGWRFYDGLVAVFKLETHCSPSQKEPFGGQETKLGGVIRDILGYGLGALPVGNIELTVVGEFIHKKFSWLADYVLPAKTIARETIRAISSYGNRMGIPMLLARMLSHPNFGGKTFALGGTVGITTEAAAQKGVPEVGDLFVLVGGRTGNDGLHGATVSSGTMTEHTDTGDSCHVQIGNAFTEQKMVQATVELRDAGCVRAVNDFGAAGIVSAMGELGESVGAWGGVLINLALVPLKCAGLANWQIALSESQERMCYVVIPGKLAEAMAIFDRYQLEATVVGIATGNGRFQMIHDPAATKLSATMALSGEIALDVPYSCFDRCPLPEIEVIEPPETERRTCDADLVNNNDVEEWGLPVVRHFDACNQSRATTQYDSTVQGKMLQGPLYGRNYNILSSLAVLKPVYDKAYGLTVSQSFSPWQFEADPVQAAINMVMDAVVTQVISGVAPEDICLADNFYTPSKDQYAWWYLCKQVRAIADLSVELGTPFITGKDSSSGSSAFDGSKLIINVLPSVCITAMGKIDDVNKLLPCQWQQPGNLLYVVGPQALTLNGSMLSAQSGNTGSWLEGIRVSQAKMYIQKLHELAGSGLVKSAVPINRGGIFLRLFEGIEASGLGVNSVLCAALFPESWGAALVEISEAEARHFVEAYGGLAPFRVGRIIDQADTFEVQDRKLCWNRLYTAWNTTFQREVMA